MSDPRIDSLFPIIFDWKCTCLSRFPTPPLIQFNQLCVISNFAGPKTFCPSRFVERVLQIDRVGKNFTNWAGCFWRPRGNNKSDVVVCLALVSSSLGDKRRPQTDADSSKKVPTSFSENSFGLSTLSNRVGSLSDSDFYGIVTPIPLMFTFSV